MISKKTLLLASVIAVYLPAVAAGLTFENYLSLSFWKPVEVTPPSSTGLDAVYVIETMCTDAKVSFLANGASPASSAQWYKFSNLGGGYAQPVASTTEGNYSVAKFSPSDVADGKGIGFIVEYDGRRYCYWVVNYFKEETHLRGLNISPELECDRTPLLFDGSAARIVYYTVNGVPTTLSRDMEFIYTTLTYNEEKQQYEPEVVTEKLEYADGTIRATAPLCDTEFTLTTDRFMRQWLDEGHPQASGWVREITSPSFHTNAISATTRAIAATRDNDNEQRDDKAPLGGSGPVDITFVADITDAVVFKEWQFSRDQQFETIDIRIQELEVPHTFNDYGTTYVRFVAGNDAGTCDFIGETYEVYVGESKLDCPNAFSPYGSEGVNDEWKVSYKSILEFDCHIFNRWGIEMAHLTDPSQGWDGRYKGKLVPSGVYYYVIKAKGTDGQDYKLSGDINILKYTSNSESTSR